MTKYTRRGRAAWLGSNAGGNYTSKVIAAGKHLEPGKVYETTIAHDDECAFFRDLPCNCDPDVVIIEVKQ